MNKFAISGSSLIALVVAGCVPMEQAVLTYTSKSTIGVGVEAGTQQTPGLDVTIGFKESNVALVPVAVAKYCEQTENAPCQDAIYELELILGEKRDLLESDSVIAELDAVNGRIEQLTQQQTSDTDRLAGLRSQVTLFEEAESAQRRLEEKKSQLDIEESSATDNPEQSGVAISELQATIADLEAEVVAKRADIPDDFNLSEAREAIADLDADLTSNSARIRTFQEQRDRLQRQIASDSSSQRTDAFSVYGRFNGEAGGNEHGATLTAGKVFATGIAAQNLTEFATASDCLASVRALAQMIGSEHPEEQRQLLASAGEICGRDDWDATPRLTKQD